MQRLLSLVLIVVLLSGCSQNFLFSGPVLLHPLGRLKILAYSGGYMLPAGCHQRIVVDLQGVHYQRRQFPVLCHHDYNQGVGLVTDTVNDGRVLVFYAVVTRDTPQAREVVTALRRGYPFEASLAFTARSTEQIPAGKFVHVNGRRLEGPFILITDSWIREVSVVVCGADSRTSVQLVR